MRAFIERSPFLCLGTANAAGKADVSTRGDPPGFVQILDDETLLIPDRPGNNHLDSIENSKTGHSLAQHPTRKFDPLRKVCRNRFSVANRR
jgi:predicted pyridoxine 5'-phosphate oxidase superfamily flavin-nucleotide-binding protein